MGASPRYFLMTLAVPAFRIGTWLDAFLAGMARAAGYLGMRFVGGDTTKSRWVSISITVLGEVSRGRALMRSGARPGDLLYVPESWAAPSLAWNLCDELSAPERTSRRVASAPVPSNPGEAWRMAREDAGRKRDDGHLRRPLNRSHSSLRRESGWCSDPGPACTSAFRSRWVFSAAPEGWIRFKWRFTAGTTMVCLSRFPVGA